MKRTVPGAEAASLADSFFMVRYDPKRDLVVLVGDLVNKGPRSAEVVAYARECGFASVRGNHDVEALKVCNLTSACFLRRGPVPRGHPVCRRSFSSEGRPAAQHQPGVLSVRVLARPTDSCSSLCLSQSTAPRPARRLTCVPMRAASTNRTLATLKGSHLWTTSR